ncbi:UNVERIFIED_CONTAM: hypothetical protein FKN15_047588 [Acipenser sinensis]
MAAIGHFIPTWILVGGLVIGHVVSSPPPSAGVSPKLTAVRGTPAAEMLLVATLAAEMLTVVQDTPAASMLVVVLGYPAVAMLAAALLTAAQGTTVVAAVLGTPLLEGQLSTKCPHSPQMRHQHELSLFGSWAGHTSLARHRDRQLVPFFCLWADEIVNVIKSRAVVMLYAAEWSRYSNVATTLGQHHVVLTVDEALYCKLMGLKWAKEEYQDFLIVRLGGLHTSLNFLKVTGKHVQSSGLLEAWVKSKILGPRTAEQVMAGKFYARGMRAHKLTLQAMWRIVIPQLLNYIENENPNLKKEIDDKSDSNHLENLLSLLATKSSEMSLKPL